MSSRPKISRSEVQAAAAVLCEHIWGTCVAVHDPERRKCNGSNCRLIAITRKALKAAADKRKVGQKKIARRTTRIPLPQGGQENGLSSGAACPE